MPMKLMLQKFMEIEMTRLYCPECSEYLEGGDGECHDCSCGWKQPAETFEDEASTLQVAYDELCEELEDSQRQLDVAAEFCRQYQIESKALSVENKQLREKLQIRDNQVASKKAVIEELEIQNNQLKAQSDVGNEINLQLNLKIMELEAENTRLGDYYMKINDMYWNDEIFEVNHGEGFYTDKFVDMVVDL